MFKQLVLIALLFSFINQSDASEQCKLINPVTKDIQNFDCPSNKPYCCESETTGAYCCVKKNNTLVNVSLTVFGIFSVVFAAMLCAGCGGKKEPAGSSPEGATAGQSQLNADAADQAVEAKKSANQPASNVGGSKIKSSKVGKSKVDTDSPSAISALDSSKPSSAIGGSTIASRTSNVGSSKISGTGSSIGSKVGGSALDSKASSAASGTGSSLDSKSTAASTVGQSALDSSASNAGSAIGSRFESRPSGVSKSGMGSAISSNITSNLTSKSSNQSKTN